MLDTLQYEFFVRSLKTLLEATGSMKMEDKAEMFDELDGYGYSLLHYFVLIGNLDCLLLLKMHGASLNKATKEKKPRTPLVIAAELGHEAIVRALMQNGARMEAPKERKQDEH